MTYPFSLDKTQEIKDYYQENGYVVIKNAISDNSIASFMKEYEALKASKAYYFRSQDTNRAEQVAVNNEGFIEHSILNPTELIFQKHFRDSASNIVHSTTVSQLLSIITSRKKHTAWQTMFFDKSTGTVAHQDHYYLDSDPAGHLVACWFALETIHEDAGAFFVVPGSHKGPLISGNIAKFGDHKEYVAKIKSLIKEKNYRPQPMLLEKGSVLLWHPFLVHGAFQNKNPLHSRKSFTAHYLPEGYGQLGKKKLPSQSVSCNSDIFLWKKSLSEQAKDHLRYIRYWAEVKLRGDELPEMEMRASEY